MGIDKNSFEEKCKILGIEPERIHRHQRRILAVLNRQSSLHIPIEDTCRIDNSGILPHNWSGIPAPRAMNQFISFIPAAGASSRYLQPLAAINQASANRDANKTLLEAKKLKNHIADACLPQELSRVVQEGITPDWSALDRDFNLPKALLPCTKDGFTFFDMKLIEDRAFGPFYGTCFVVAPEKLELFRQKARESSLEPFFYVQGPDESTIRFNLDGTPYLEEHDQLSMVPAGHGTLARIISRLGEEHKSAHSVLIRNVDNVLGTKLTVINAAAKFLADHEFLIDKIKKIRQGIDQENPEIAAHASKEILAAFEPYSLTADEESWLNDIPLRTRDPWKVQLKLFHFHPDMTSFFKFQNLDKLLEKLFKRPVVTLGQVPNTRNDVGGTPVFAKFNNKRVKLCLEVPHASDEDVAEYLRNPEKATHFNPVFVAAETRFDRSYFENEDLSSWLLAKKTYKGVNVVYHESVLYELLGNNILANCVFTEIPRCLFNPHKTLKDASGKISSDWLS